MYWVSGRQATRIPYGTAIFYPKPLNCSAIFCNIIWGKPNRTLKNPKFRFDMTLETSTVQENHTEVGMKARHKSTLLGIVFVLYTLLVAGMFYSMGSAESPQISVQK